jgi:hypothetical protein
MSLSGVNLWWKSLNIFLLPEEIYDNCVVKGSTCMWACITELVQFSVHSHSDVVLLSRDEELYWGQTSMSQ